ncbi:unnamed protein product [Cochlearia groenlandica]
MSQQRKRGYQNQERGKERPRAVRQSFRSGQRRGEEVKNQSRQKINLSNTIGTERKGRSRRRRLLSTPPEISHQKKLETSGVVPGRAAHTIALLCKLKIKTKQQVNTSSGL